MIGVGAQSTLGGHDIFAPKMYEKLTKCPNFTCFLAEESKYPNFNDIFPKK